MMPVPSYLDKLSLEIWLQIVHYLHADLSSSVHQFRLSCRQTNGISIPSIFRQIEFTERKLEKSMEEGPLRERIVQNVETVIIRLPLKWERLVGLLRSCSKLRNIEWYFNSTNWDMLVFPNLLKEYLDGTGKHLQLSVKELHFPFSMGSAPDYPYPSETLPALSIISLDITLGNPGYIVEPIQNLLIECKNLKTLSIQLYHEKFITTKARLPPITELKLRPGFWSYHNDEVQQIWDFTKLRHLEISWWNLLYFLRSIDMSELGTLKSLLINYECYHRGNYRPLQPSLVDLDAERMSLLRRLMEVNSSGSLSVKVYSHESLAEWCPDHPLLLSGAVLES